VEIVGYVTLRKNLSKQLGDVSEKELEGTVEVRLDEMKLPNEFLRFFLLVAGKRSANTWLRAFKESLDTMRQEGHCIVSSALSFLLPIAYLMVGKGTKLVKPGSVKRMGANLMTGPLYDLQVKDARFHYPIRGSSDQYVECIRTIQKRVFELGAKMYAEESASKQIMTKGKSSDVSQPFYKVSLLTSDDYKAVMEDLPQVMNRLLNLDKIVVEIEGIQKKIQQELAKRQRAINEKHWTPRDEEALTALIDPLYYELFLLHAVCSMRKEDLSVRLSALQKSVQKGSKSGDSYRFKEDSLIYG
jgi:hypothetical protein